MAKKKPSLGRENDLLRTACFVLFDAMLLQEIAARGKSGVPAGSLRANLLDRWRKRRRGVQPIIDLARDILAALPGGPVSERLLAVLSGAARDAAQSRELLSTDFIGRIYNELLLGASGHHYAAYYTSAPAAQLLAGLVLRPSHPSWKFSTIAQLRRLRIVDPACGSGTLLSAAHNVMRAQHAARNAADRAKLGSTLVEHVLHGWDVLDFPLQLARMTLALHAGDQFPKTFNIERKPLDIDRRRVRLGSLDLLNSKIARHDKFDVVLMNPPFSRSAKPNIKFGFGKEEQRRRMSRALADLGKARNLRKASIAGLTPFFMQLALDLLKDGGRTGMVVPRSNLSGVGTLDIRRKFEKETRLGFIVSNFDPGSAGERVDGWSWSENTDLGEVLITAEKSGGVAGQHECTFVNLCRRPRDEFEALAVSQEIVRASNRANASLLRGHHKELKSNGQLIGMLYRVPQARLGGNWLKACTFAAPALNRLCLEVLSHRAMKPLCECVETLNREHALGRDIAAIKPNFAVGRAGSDARIVLGHQSDMNTLDLAAVHLRDAKAKGDKAKLMFANFASMLLVAERPHLSTESLLAMRAPERVVATAFWEVQPKPDLEEWLLLWLNSTYGVMTFLANATSSQADIFKMKKDQLRELPVPMPARLSGVSRLHEKLKQQPFRRYPEEFRQASECDGPRFALDTFFASALGLPPLTTELYLALSRDPPISRKAIC